MEKYLKLFWIFFYKNCFWKKNWKFFENFWKNIWEKTFLKHFLKFFKEISFWILSEPFLKSFWIFWRNFKLFWNFIWKYFWKKNIWHFWNFLERILLNNCWTIFFNFFLKTPFSKHFEKTLNFFEIFLKIFETFFWKVFCKYF